MILREVIQGIEILKMNADANLPIGRITSKSKDAGDGAAFVCIKGERFDGHDFIGEALRQGASCVIVSDPPADQTIPYIQVKNTRRTLSLMLNNFYGRPHESFRFRIGVTGTNGKTSTTYMLKSIFEAAGCKVGLIGTMKYLIGDNEYNSESGGNLLTTPDSENFFALLDVMRAQKVDCLIMEVSSHALALNKIDGIWFDRGIFTNLTQDHLNFHGDLETYRKEKTKLFSMCGKGVLNQDDPAAEAILKEAGCDCLTYSAESDSADFTAKNIRLKGASGVEYEMLTQSLIFRIRLPIPGLFSVYNSLAAAACALSLGLSADSIAAGLETMKNVTGRIDRVPIDAEYSVIIDYAHTPDALFNILSVVRQFAPGRIITLFGCGGDRDKTKRPKMGRIAMEHSDYCVITSDNARTENKADIIRDILAGTGGIKTPHRVIEDRTEAIRHAMDIARRDDIILLAGKGHEEYEIDRTGKHPYSERQIVIDYFKEQGERS